jgi:polyhydroxyalkanoate synthesis regulator phasin
MIDIIRKTLLAGVGAAVVTREKAESALGEFVRQGKVSSAEAREMAGRIADEGRREFDRMTEDLDQRLRLVLDGVDGSARRRLDALEARVTVLETAAANAANREADAPGAAGRD